MGILSDLPTIHHKAAACAIMASIKYQVPANILLAIAEKEGGKPGSWVKNTNGTYDVGSMQFNTQYLKELEPYGIKPEDVAAQGCYSYDLAAWRVRGHLLKDDKDLWTRASNYHSKTPKYNQIYRKDLIKKANKWQKWLNTHFKTYAVNTPGVTPAYVKQINHVIHTDAVKLSKNKTQNPFKPRKKELNLAAEEALANRFGGLL